MKPHNALNLALLTGLFLIASGVQAAPCTASATALCLAAQRFNVEIRWKDFQGNTGQGQAVGLTPDTGYFWFFTDNNIELVVKVLDARTFNNNFWVFFGALSNVEYTLTVTDTATGRTKSYVNPSGQFASVGDTAAFAGATVGVAATRETVVVKGTRKPPESFQAIQKFVDAAAAKSSSPGSEKKTSFTPCPGTSTSLFLSNCRFQLTVRWTDFQGQTGEGRAVQLTSDTGYFWFFTDNNVELIVKVLDARAFNGSFWVFFGALSNVKYALTVKDLFTGALKRYENPSGAFASVGDTSAIRGGYSVASVPDPGRAVSADLAETGGSFSATGADGTIFTLEIPPNALPSPQVVTLTPVSRIDRFPFSGGLLAGVEIGPEGLDLMLPATLTIRPASPLPVAQTLPYSYSRGGEDFILYPRNVDTSSLRLPLVRFAGYGAGQGDQAEAANQAEKLPAGFLEASLQRYAYEVFRRVLGQISQAELIDRGIQIYREAFRQAIAPFLPSTGKSRLAAAGTRELTCDEGTLDSTLQVLGVIKQKQMLGVVDPETGEVETGLGELKKLLGVCMQASLGRCVSRNDPYEVLRMVQIAVQLQTLGEEDPNLTTFIQGGVMERCLRFELDFESKIVLVSTAKNAGGTTRLKYRSAHVPLRFSYGGNTYSSRQIWEGACTLLPEDAALELPYSIAPCSLTVQARKSWFQAFAVWIGALNDPTKSAVRVLYYPGSPKSTAILICPDEPSTELGVLRAFDAEYAVLHKNEAARVYGVGFMAKDWTPLRFGPGPSQNGEFFAMKSYERPGVIWETPELILTEETFFFLKHMPDSPMPDCPSDASLASGSAPK